MSDLSAVVAALQPRAYQPSGPLAIHPQAIGADFIVPSIAPVTFPNGQVSLVEIGGGGPLAHHITKESDSYDAIKARVCQACEATQPIILLSIDTPGGLLAGCFDTVTEIRAMAAAANKRLFVYVDSMAASAAYALACTGERIFCPPTGLVGSIGVIETLPDTSILDAARGLKFQVIYSGSRKADTNEHVPFADRAAGLTAVQAQVDGLAEVFFDLVAQYRPLNREAVKALEAACFFGKQAVAVGLADQIATLDETIQLLSSPGFLASANPTPETQEGSPMLFADVMRALTEAGSSDWSDEEKKAAATLMNALSAEAAPKEEPATEPDGDEAPAETPAEDDSKDEAKDPDGAPKKFAQLQAVTKRLDGIERASLLATRPDFTPEVRATLESSPLLTVQAAVKSWPKMLKVDPTNTPKGHVSGALAALNTGRTQGTGEYTPALPTQRQELAIRMGLAQASSGPRLIKDPMTASRAKYVFEMPALGRQAQASYLSTPLQGAK